VPAADALDLTGLNLRPEDVQALVATDTAGWKKEAEDVTANYAKFGSRLPGALSETARQLRQRLG